MGAHDPKKPYQYEPFFDGHELSVVSLVASCLVLVDRTLPNGWIKHFIHRHPAPALASAGAALGFGLIIIGPRVRRLMGLSTDNYNNEVPGAYRQPWRQEPEI